MPYASLLETTVPNYKKVFRKQPDTPKLTIPSVSNLAGSKVVPLRSQPNLQKEAQYSVFKHRCMVQHPGPCMNPKNHRGIQSPGKGSLPRLMGTTRGYWLPIGSVQSEGFWEHWNTQGWAVEWRTC